MSHGTFSRELPTAPAELKGGGSANTFAVLRIDSDAAAHRATELPYGWSGRPVRLACLTASAFVDVGIAARDDAEIDSTVAPANTHTDAKVGLRVTVGIPVTVTLPTWDAVEKRYLVHEASAANTILEAMLAG
jgi:hypothetical protein